MGDMRFVQCQSCGELHQVNSKCIVMDDDDLYVNIYCGKCRDETAHLDIGKYKDDVHASGNLNLIEDYFLY